MHTCASISSPADISWGEDILVQPDVFVVPLREARTLDWAVADAMVVEVWTPEAAFPLFEREQLVWHPTGGAEPLVISLPGLFLPL